MSDFTAWQVNALADKAVEFYEAREIRDAVRRTRERLAIKKPAFKRDVRTLLKIVEITARSEIDHPPPMGAARAIPGLPGTWQRIA